MDVNKSVNLQNTNEQTQKPPTVSSQPEIKRNYWKLGFFVTLFLWLLSVFILVTCLNAANKQGKEKVQKDGLSPVPTDIAQINQPGEQEGPCLGKTRFAEAEDSLEDKTDSVTQWKKFTNKEYQVSFLYPPQLIRSSQNYWSYPKTGAPLEGAEMFMTVGSYYSAIHSIEDMNSLLAMNIDEEMNVNIDSDEEFKIKKIREKKEGNFSGSIYQNIITEQNYWHPFYSYVFISDILTRDKRLVLQYNFQAEEDRDNSRDDFIKIINSLKFEDYDADFIKSLGLADSGNKVEFLDTKGDGGIYYLNKLSSDISDLEGELFQLEKQNNEVFGYAISRTVCLNDLVGKRMIVVLRRVEGLKINNKNVYFIDDINVV